MKPATIATFLAIIFCIIDACAAYFYFEPFLVHGKISEIKLEAVIIHAFSVLAHIGKIIGVIKKHTTTIKAWMVFAFLKAWYNGYLLYEWILHLWPQVSLDSPESIQTLIITIVFATVMFAMYILALIIACKAIFGINEEQHMSRRRTHETYELQRRA